MKKPTAPAPATPVATSATRAPPRATACAAATAAVTATVAAAAARQEHEGVDETGAGTSTFPFDRGKRSPRSAGRGEDILGVTRPFDRDKSFGHCSIKGGGRLRVWGQCLEGPRVQQQQLAEDFHLPLSLQQRHHEQKECWRNTSSTKKKRVCSHQIRNVMTE